MQFAKASFVYDILSKEKTKKQYDASGRQTFEAAFAAAVAAVQDAAGVATNTGGTAEAAHVLSSEAIIRMSPINYASIKAWMDKAAMRELYHGCHTFAEILMAQLLRAGKVDDRPGLWTWTLDMLSSLEFFHDVTIPRSRNRKPKSAS